MNDDVLVDKLPKNVANDEFLSIFSDDNLTKEFKIIKGKKRKKHNQDDLFYEQVEEQKQRRWFRWIMLVLFFLLLIVQHVLISLFVYDMISRDLIGVVQPLLAVIIPATLGETYAIINVMVKFIFSPGNFEHKTKTNC